MKKKNILKLVLYEDGKEVKIISEPNTEESLTYILELSEKWKKENIKKNTVRFCIEK